jgi:hypothetical protein
MQKSVAKRTVGGWCKPRDWLLLVRHPGCAIASKSASQNGDPIICKLAKTASMLASEMVDCIAVDESLSGSYNDGMRGWYRLLLPL